jgi:transcriptional regulator with XRE-family HTH domain
MSIADWDPAACNGRAGLPESVKENQSQHFKSDHLEADQFKPDSTVEKAPNECAKAAPKPEHALHRLAAVRREQGVSLRNMARRLGTDVASVLHQEQETSDLPLTMLYEWQRALDVPVADLLVDSDAPLSAPVLERARLVKVMKTVVAIMEKAQSNSQRRMVTMLMEQLIEIMPELREVSAWHSVGQRRTLDEFGRAIERTMPEDLLHRNR